MLVCFAFCTLVHRKPEIGTSETVTLLSDMEFVKNFTPSISPNFNSFSEKKAQKKSENGEIYTAGKNFTLPPALTAWTNSTTACIVCIGKSGSSSLWF